MSFSAPAGSGRMSAWRGQPGCSVRGMCPDVAPDPCSQPFWKRLGARDTMPGDHPEASIRPSHWGLRLSTVRRDAVLQFLARERQHRREASRFPYHANLSRVAGTGDAASFTDLRVAAQTQRDVKPLWYGANPPTGRSWPPARPYSLPVRDALKHDRCDETLHFARHMRRQGNTRCQCGESTGVVPGHLGIAIHLILGGLIHFVGSNTCSGLNKRLPRRGFEASIYLAKTQTVLNATSSPAVSDVPLAAWWFSAVSCVSVVTH